jgi:hypothetical protein
MFASRSTVRVPTSVTSGASNNQNIVTSLATHCYTVMEI